MSYNATYEWPMARYYQAYIVTEKPDHEGITKKIAEKIRDAYAKSGVPAHWAMYESIAGTPSGVFQVIIPLRSLAQVDTAMLNDAKFSAALGEQGGAEINRLAADGIASQEVQLVAVDPKMSVVDDRWRAADVAFRGKKPETGAVMQAGAARPDPAKKKDEQKKP